MTERIDDGFPTLIELTGLDSGETIKLWEKTVTPPGVDGGGENDTSTMRNLIWRTKSAKGLKSLTDMSFVAAYDPEVYDQVVALINVNQQIVITFPDDSTLTFWGWLNTFTPGEIAEGVQPTADCTISASNQDNTGAEAAPEYAA